MGRLREGLGSLQAKEHPVGGGSSAPERGGRPWKEPRTNTRGFRCEGRGETPGKLGQDGEAGAGSGERGADIQAEAGGRWR